jgi:hypothetical protein
MPQIWLVSGLLYLDSGRPTAISPAPGAGYFSRCLFLRGFEGIAPRSRGDSRQSMIVAVKS